MARQEEKSTHPEDSIRHAGEQAAEQPRRIGLAAAQATEEVAKTSAALFQQNTEFLRNSWRFGVDVATAVVGQSADQFGRTLGLSGSEAQRATERSARNAETILYSATAASKGWNGLSQEYFQFIRRQLETNMERVNELWRCRSPHDVVAVQSDLVGDALGSFLESSRRMADLSLKLTEDAAKHVTENMERMKRAA
ncbi:MAG: phasin family protein [Bradyrhizobium sp.]|nr:phasin family protein [Bradyrhizobium sp.]